LLVNLLRAYFTDKVRGAVIRLSMDGLRQYLITV
jgi:hypothetical protein